MPPTTLFHRLLPLHALLVAGVSATVLLVNLGGPALWDEDEPKNAACTLAMLSRNDWVVPTFNGRLRIEKPALVNWVQIAGCGIAGRTEAGLRLGSALLTIGTCLMTWRIGRLLAGDAAGLVAGLVMACSVWTAVGGRAATPDPPLVFCSTAAFGILASASTRSGQRLALSAAEALGFGAACGLGVLAKGPIGVLLPVAAVAFLGILELRRAPRIADFRGGWQRLRLGTIALTTVAVAAPWYLWVTWRTGGEWLRGFLVDHNVERFTSTLEGHSGTFLYYPVVLLVGLFPWSIAAAAAAWHAARLACSQERPREARAVLVAAVWAATWVGFFTAAGTKLPGYIWPAYPAIAVILGIFWNDWRERRLAGIDRFMPLAWGSFAVVGIALAVGLPIAAGRLADGCGWCGLVGLVPLAAGFACWRLQSRHDRTIPLAAIVCSGTATLVLLCAVVTDAIGSGRTPRTIAPLVADRDGAGPVASFRRVSPSVVFYAALARDAEPVPELWEAADVARHFSRHPTARLVTESRFLEDVAGSLPEGLGVIGRFRTLPSATEFVVVGRTDASEATASQPRRSDLAAADEHGRREPGP